MEQWAISDVAALELIEFAGKLGEPHKRPRFRFSPHQKQLTTYLAEIDAALSAIGQEPAWLGSKNHAPPFLGQTPFTFMVENGEEGMAEVLQSLNKMVLRS